jgi:hypothetical protein
MELTDINVSYEIEKWRDPLDQQHTLYRYTIYKLTPYKEKVLVGEKRTFQQAKDEAKRYVKIAARAWSTPVWITGP